LELQKCSLLFVFSMKYLVPSVVVALAEPGASPAALVQAAAAAGSFACTPNTT
jgi:hypothetical protein